MLKMHGVITALCLPLLLHMNFAQAEKVVKGDVEVLLQQHKVVMLGNTEVIEPVEHIKPGEIVEYQATYRNTTHHVIHQLQATLPIPPETEYLPGSARPQPVMASVDGISYAPVPLRKNVKLADGKIEEQDVPVSEYRSLRWAIGDIGAGQKIPVFARVRIAPVSGAVAEEAKK